MALLQADAEPLGRQVALYGVVIALTQRLRSVFAPYFRYLLDGALAHLAGGAPSAAVQPKKKRKKSAAVAAASLVAGGEANGGGDPALVRDAWLLRLRVRPALP